MNFEQGARLVSTTVGIVLPAESIYLPVRVVLEGGLFNSYNKPTELNKRNHSSLRDKNMTPTNKSTRLS